MKKLLASSILLFMCYTLQAQKSFNQMLVEHETNKTLFTYFDYNKTKSDTENKDILSKGDYNEITFGTWVTSGTGPKEFDNIIGGITKSDGPMDSRTINVDQRGTVKYDDDVFPAYLRHKETKRAYPFGWIVLPDAIIRVYNLTEDASTFDIGEVYLANGGNTGYKIFDRLNTTSSDNSDDTNSKKKKKRKKKKNKSTTLVLEGINLKNIISEYITNIRKKRKAYTPTEDELNRHRRLMGWYGDTEATNNKYWADRKAKENADKKGRLLYKKQIIDAGYVRSSGMKVFILENNSGFKKCFYKGSSSSETCLENGSFEVLDIGTDIYKAIKNGDNFSKGEQLIDGHDAAGTTVSF
ncbi:hypothetical protein [Aquimarina sp. 2201CG5-10]|uniref:hypothetical protein n=1 Tax=Aquimarina callyspongiae TaxID=3098150 RepID=UPI002AB3B2D6|nr:hypothetical protein [Aquimarina sp. 2201CG5-10]MDY8136308.1 hypothetical protein [Aquimarina sp. 2201CG5-10]